MYTIIGRKAFAIWLALFTMLQWPLVQLGGFNHSVVELIVMMVICAVLSSCIIGIIFHGIGIIYGIIGLWTYYFDHSQWLMTHGHGIGTPGFSFERIFWNESVLSLLMALLLTVHFYICIRRCKDAGKSAWWSLIPLYNPFMLLLLKSR